MGGNPTSRWRSRYCQVSRRCVVSTASPTVGGPRACAAAEFDGVIELLDRVFREGSDQSAQTDYPLIFDPARRENMRVISVDGAVVAHVPVASRGVVIDGDAFTLAIIGGTVTHPDDRHRGYATACLRDGVRIMRERGWPVSALWTIERTFPFYRNSGWEAVGSQGWMYTLAADDVARLRTSRHRIAVYEPGNHQQLSTIRDIHDREPLRIARSPDDYAVLFSLPKMHTLLALEGDDVAAYLTVGQGRTSSVWSKGAATAGPWRRSCATRGPHGRSTRTCK